VDECIWAPPRNHLSVCLGNDRAVDWLRSARRSSNDGRPSGKEALRQCSLVRGLTEKHIDNDPSAGSPTETLLRLLLPLNDKVQWTSHDVASGRPLTSPQSEHFTGPFNR